MHSIFWRFCVAIHDLQSFLTFFCSCAEKSSFRFDPAYPRPDLASSYARKYLFEGYFQCNVSIYAHVRGLKLHKILQVRAPIWVSTSTSVKSCTDFLISGREWAVPLCCYLSVQVNPDSNLVVLKRAYEYWQLIWAFNNDAMIQENEMEISLRRPWKAIIWWFKIAVADSRGETFSAFA
jgi:hypothetical protein